MENAHLADKVNARLGHIAGLRAGQSYRIWIEERQLLRWFVRCVYAECEDKRLKDAAGEFLKYFKKYQQAE